MAGPSNDGLVMPGHGAAISLVQVTFALIMHGREFVYGPERSWLQCKHSCACAMRRVKRWLAAKRSWTASRLNTNWPRRAACASGSPTKFRHIGRRARWRALRRTQAVLPAGARPTLRVLDRSRADSAPKPIRGLSPGSGRLNHEPLAVRCAATIHDVGRRRHFVGDTMLVVPFEHPGAPVPELRSNLGRRRTGVDHQRRRRVTTSLIRA